MKQQFQSKVNLSNNLLCKTSNVVLALAFTLVSTSLMAQVGIGTVAPDDSAVLDVVATDKGFLPPRLNTSQRNGITTPAMGLTIFNTDKLCLEVFVGLGWRSMCGQVNATDVFNPETGQIWMDRNLGATQVATASNDAAAYGDLYQWGRLAEGHQVRTSGTYDGNVVANRPANPTASGAWDGLFITDSADGGDVRNWFQGIDNTLWQGVTGGNNPCPTGYRVPTEVELDAERASWDSQNAAGAFGSPVKWAVAGQRNLGTGNVTDAGSLGRVWSSTISGDSVRHLNFGGGAGFGASRRASGYSVRCIKD